MRFCLLYESCETLFCSKHMFINSTNTCFEFRTLKKWVLQQNLTIYFFFFFFFVKTFTKQVLKDVLIIPALILQGLGTEFSIHHHKGSWIEWVFWGLKNLGSEIALSHHPRVTQQLGWFTEFKRNVKSVSRSCVYFQEPTKPLSLKKDKLWALVVTQWRLYRKIWSWKNWISHFMMNLVWIGQSLWKQEMDLNSNEQITWTIE